MLGTKFCGVAHLHPHKEDHEGFILEIKGGSAFGLRRLGLCKLIKECMYQFDIVGECWFYHRSPPCEVWLLLQVATFTDYVNYLLCTPLILYTVTLRERELHQINGLPRPLSCHWGRILAATHKHNANNPVFFFTVELIDIYLIKRHEFTYPYEEAMVMPDPTPHK